MKRGLFVASSLSAATLSGCGLGNALSQNDTVQKILGSVQGLNRVVIGTRGMAKEYPDSAVDRNFRVNGLDTPSDSVYQGLVHGSFAQYALIVDGLVDHKQLITLAQLRKMPLQTQTTRHDCVEGWSAIGKWSGVRLSDVLALAAPTAQARYVVFHCFDKDDSGAPYYESLSLHEAAHPQALLALDLNEAPLDPDHGAPVRLRVPTQLGYKSAKWVHRIEVAANFHQLYDGKGGYWEDRGYQWYAGI